MPESNRPALLRPLLRLMIFCAAVLSCPFAATCVGAPAILQATAEKESAQEQTGEQPQESAPSAEPTGSTTTTDDEPAAQAALPPGISDEQPEQGEFVAIESGEHAGRFMVEYEVTIPGTSATFEMVPVPGGVFLMGSAESEQGRSADEGPQRYVHVPPMWVGKHEVTWACYKSYMRLEKQFKKLQARGLRQMDDDNRIDAVSAPSSLYDPGYTYANGQDADQPAASMTRYAAMQYTKWVSLLTTRFYRLPTEAEWEYACRAGTTTRWYFGDDEDDLEDHAWILDNSDEERQEVGQLEPNPWGLYDMYGNVAEWTLDAYDESGYAAEENSEDKPLSRESAFARPENVFPCVVRGGSFDCDEPELCRSASRTASDDPVWKNIDPCLPKSPWWFTTEPAMGVGFRIVRPFAEPEDRDLKDAYWDEKIESIESDVNNRVDLNGRGSRGIVDPDLPAALEQLKRR